MDKTIEVVLVAVVVIATAAILLFIFTGESTNFSDFLTDSREGAECELAINQCDEQAFNNNNCSEKGYGSFSSLNCDQSSGTKPEPIPNG